MNRIDRDSLVREKASMKYAAPRRKNSLFVSLNVGEKAVELGASG
jgi:hypothetical protein